jgi:glycosyltransferase involved in cell wall biosynthesis
LRSGVAPWPVWEESDLPQPAKSTSDVKPTPKPWSMRMRRPQALEFADLSALLAGDLSPSSAKARPNFSTFTGQLPPADVPPLLARADILALPNPASAISTHATSPLKLFEYMAAGLPVVAPDQPNLREVLESEGNALLVPREDGEALAVAVTRLVGDAELRRRLGRAARRTVVERDLTWRGNARRVVAAVEGIS